MRTLSQEENLVQCHDKGYHGEIGTYKKSLAVPLFAFKFQLEIGSQQWRKWSHTGPLNVLRRFILCNVQLGPHYTTHTTIL